MQTGQQGTQDPTEQVEPPQGQPAEVHATTPQASAPNSQPAGEGTAPAGQQPAGQEGQQQQPTGDGGGDDGVQATGGGFLVKTEAFKRLKQKERNRGKREGLEEYARERGFESVEAMEAAMGKNTNDRPAARRRRKRRTRGTRSDGAAAMPNTNESDPTTTDEVDGQPDPKELQRQIRKLERQRDKVLSTNQSLSQRMKRETAKTKRLRNERDAIEAEGAIRQAAAQAGIQVKDIKYAMHLLTEHLVGKPIEELQDFDEVLYFEGLRKEHGYLFGQRTQPATTGNSAGDGPSAPTPGAIKDGAAHGSQTDARKMSNEEYRAHLVKRGLNPPA